MRIRRVFFWCLPTSVLETYNRSESSEKPRPSNMINMPPDVQASHTGEQHSTSESRSQSPCPEPLTQETVGNAARVSTVTIRNRYGELLDIYAEEGGHA